MMRSTTAFQRRHGMGRARASRQRGVTLIIGLIMTVLITLVVVGAFSVSSSNLKSVRNMQVREEALAAANRASEQFISTSFASATLTTSSYNIDINQDGATDYVVSIGLPTCLRAVEYPGGPPSETELSTSISGSNWGVDWDLDTRVTDAVTGASVRVRQGVRVLLSTAQKTAVCP